MSKHLGDLGLLWLRVLVGLGFMVHGWLKFSSVGLQTFAEKTVEPMGFPVPIVFAALAVAAELLGGMFLVMGLWTRLGALATAVNMAVASFVHHAADTFFDKEKALLYGAAAVAILLLGPGRFSFDGLRGSNRRARPRQTRK